MSVLIVSNLGRNFFSVSAALSNVFETNKSDNLDSASGIESRLFEQRTSSFYWTLDVSLVGRPSFGFVSRFVALYLHGSPSRVLVLLFVLRAWNTCGSL